MGEDGCGRVTVFGRSGNNREFVLGGKGDVDDGVGDSVGSHGPVGGAIATDNHCH